MRRAFTLLELLVVVAIVALLAAILFPTFSQAREKARQASCLSNVHQLSLAQLMYIADWDESLPSWYVGETYWPQFFQPYLKSQAVLLDRSARGETMDNDSGTRLADYALFTWAPDRVTGSLADPYWRWPGAPLQLAEVRRPTETFNLMDGFTATFRTRGIFTRHGNGMNGGFLDGHAKWITPGFANTLVLERGEYFFRYATADR